MSVQAPRVLKLGVAGLGRAFTLMLPAFRTDPRVKLVAAADRYPARACMIAADHVALVLEAAAQLGWQGIVPKRESGQADPARVQLAGLSRPPGDGVGPRL